MYSHVSEKSGLKAPLIADDVYEVIMNVSLFISNRLSFPLVRNIGRLEVVVSFHFLNGQFVMKLIQWLF